MLIAANILAIIEKTRSKPDEVITSSTPR